MGPTDTAAAERDRRRRLAALRKRMAESGGAAGGGAEPAPVAFAPGAETPASPAQQRLWLQHAADATGAALNVGTALTLRGPIGIPALTAAARAVAGHHEILRTRYTLSATGELLAVPDLSAETLPVTVTDARGSDLDALIAAELRTPFDLEAEHPVRLTLYAEGPEHHTLLLVAHHIAWDDACWAIFFDDLAAAYRGHSLTPAVRYAEAAHAMRLEHSAALPALQRYWAKALAGADPATGLGSVVAQDHTGVCRFHEESLDPALSGTVEALARQHSTTPFVVLLTAFAAGLRHHTGNDRAVIGTPVTQRDSELCARSLGYFGNVVLLPLSVPAGHGLGSLTERTGQTVTDALQHQDLPYSEAVRLLGASGRARPIEVSFGIEDAGVHLTLPGVAVEARAARGGIGQVPLSVMARRAPDGCWVLRFEYLEDAFPDGRIDSFARTALRVLRAALRAPATSLTELPLVTEKERELLLGQGSSPAFIGPWRSATDRIEAQAAARPDAVAVRAAGSTLTYRELNDRAAAVGRWIAARGIGPEDLVACALGRTADSAVVALGVLKSGAALLPLDVAHPADRLARLLAEAAPRHLFTSAATDDRVPAGAVPRTVVDSSAWHTELEQFSGPGELRDRDRVRPLRPQNLAYVIYTSGSTGAPKGVGTTHAALGDHLEWLTGHFRSTHDEGERVRWLQLASPAFDVSLGELLGPLCVGGEVLVPRAGAEGDLDLLLAEVDALRATVVHAVPSFLNYLAAAAPQRPLTSLRWLPVGGEALPGELADRVRARFGNGGRLTLGNYYGPTETTQSVTGYRVESPQGNRTVPIGRPKWGNTALLLDSALGLTPPGETGELYLEGSSLARGYLGRPALTAERFVPSPLTPGQRLYRTGDLARFGADGELEFVGRADDQVKIRGFRVEPGEIEVALRAQDGVEQAVVVAREQAETGTGLVAYLTPAEGRDIDLPALRARLTAALPAHMVPGSFVVLEKLPLTPAGKTDRRALPEAPPEETAAFRPLDNVLEREIAALFAELLAPAGEPAAEPAESDAPTVGGRRVGSDTSFFELGGHSLLLTRLLSRLRHRYGTAVAVRDAFTHSTPAGLARLVREGAGDDGDSGSAPPLTARTRPETVPLSFAQQRIWFVDRIETDSTTYNVPIALDLAGPLDTDALRGALGDLLLRHESLRTVFPDHEGVGRQEVLDDHRVELPVTGTEPENLESALAGAAGHPFDLTSERPLRATLFRVSEQHHVLSLLLHHIVCDEVSASLLVDDLTRAYAARLDGAGQGGAQVLPSLPVQYADYALWQRERLDAADGSAGPLTEFWRGYLADLPQDTAMATDRPRPVRPDPAGGVVPFSFDADVRRGVERLAEATGATPFIVLQAAVATLLCKLGAGDDVPLGTPVANRPDEAVTEAVGLFVNLLVVRNDLTGNPTLDEIVRRARARAVDAYHHAELPFERMVEAAGAERSLSVNPLFQVLVQLRDEENLLREAGGLRWRSLPQHTTTAKYDLSVNFEPDGRSGGWGGELIYRRDLYDEATVRQLADRLGLVLRTMGTEPGRRLHTLELVTEAERQLILDEWSRGPEAAPDRAETLPELIERSRAALGLPGRAERTAVECAGRTIDYAELHRRSDRLARLLLARGAGPDRFVAIAVPRSIDMVVALLAVVKTGAAYLPLDLRLPAERLEYMIGDAAPVAVLTRSDALAGLPGTSATPLIPLDGAEAVAELAAQPDERLPEEESRRARGENISYFLYTSGSTGVPKGVIGTQRAYAARLAWQPVHYPVPEPDVRLCQGWLSFHDGGCEILAGLIAGARLIVADEAEARDVGSLAGLIENNPIGQVTAVPTAINALIGVSPEAVRSVPRWISSGEPMTEALLRRLRAAAPDAEIVNNYGATELSGGVVRGPMHRHGLHLGTPVAGARVLVLDRHLNLCPPGVPGEVYAAGHQPARGYWKRPGLSAARFLPDPYADTPGTLLYRTGDRARWSRDGRLLFEGRTDHQVKVRGIRLELGEIEAVMRMAPEVALAAARTHLENDSTLLAGYVTLADPGSDRDAALASVREHLARELPLYLHPSVLTVLDAMPLTGSGKLNRPALPLPDPRTSGTRQPPRGATEEAVAALFSDVLGTADIGREDGFFALGGDSIISVQLASRARAKGLRVTAQMVFENPTVAELAEACERAAEDDTPDRGTAPGTPAADTEVSGLDKDTLQALLGSWKRA
ncbi:amino acid adenylation domain-containing protein [Streptomyces sp. NPDC057552]|uniref:amino acid adenylation domain-containing protein n=1 Tax=Streptomyces sp. NPDC057552 TaxID=3350537 RepID=UPI0036BA0FB2